MQHDKFTCVHRYTALSDDQNV